MDLIVALFRVVANESRLRMHRAVHWHPGITVGELAQTVGLSAVAASQHLRVLAEFGVVDPRPSGRRVEVHPARRDGARSRLTWMVHALLRHVWELAEEPAADQNPAPAKVWDFVTGTASAPSAEPQALYSCLLRAFTSYTHLRRLLVLRHLAREGPLTAPQLSEPIGMSESAAQRQVDKLRRRGVLVRSGTQRPLRWRVASQLPSPFQHALHRAVIRRLTASDR